MVQLERSDRLRGALWGLFAGDALSSPTHWFYGGEGQVREVYGGLIRGYKKPVSHLAGSIMGKSNTDGGGRGQYSASKRTIIGDVINHGKKKYWDPSKSYHYHCTLEAGENTLEAQLVRVLMKTMKDGSFESDLFREAYVSFMTTPGSHNDSYASTCHRMFFANLEYKKLPLKDCPDNDSHNVDAIDGLVLPTVSALAEAYVFGDRSRAKKIASETCGATRKSTILQKAAEHWTDVLCDVFLDDKDAAEAAGFSGATSKLKKKRDPVVACYLASALPACLEMTAKYADADVFEALMANANAGGENVHRGALLGAVLGANAGDSKLPPELKAGLDPRLKHEIDTFIQALDDRRHRIQGEL